ncbi:NAD(+) synthase [Acetobacterium tundrae]|uniref:Glutamine-dependent NAD(+) synthetase n=1 Tax=Acetobacterium tundrae TaxID=132932 RepID=A0ABR6WHY5_9FIRM|nr:NAD(+) synthase [Acetobacterium tundrae]MBC3795898.1 NAD(+) synthase [Acetobacterium tundrae]
MHKYGFVRTACAVPKLKLADCEYNVGEIISLATTAFNQGIEVLLFPELCLTGYTCGDLFFQRELQKNALNALDHLCRWSDGKKILIVVGLPLVIAGSLYNCSAAVNDGRILGIVPKTYIPNHQEFYEKRWFASSKALMQREVTIGSQTVPIGTDLLFKNAQMEEFVIGIEICEDLWMPIPPGSFHALAGATVILNPSASNEIVGKSDYRRELIRSQSGRCNLAYLYTSAGFGESTSDLVFGGNAIICEKGVLLKELPKFNLGNEILVADIDIESLIHDRQSQHTLLDSMDLIKEKPYRSIIFETQDPEDFEGDVNPHPFVPRDPNRRSERCEEIFNIQTMGLASRLKHIGNAPMIVGISGGLDSTMALLVCVSVCDRFNISREKIHAVTMPGFGTTDRTYDNAVALIKGLGATFHEISIVEACKAHFKDIGQPITLHNVTYENAQARERTQILMDLSNKLGGIVIGTGDLSELALGWATYNGDHMSMYNVNASVPKTLIRYLVEWVAEHSKETEIQKILYDVLDTPVSPELLPPDENGKIAQKTEETVGPYELHDFFIFQVVRYGFSPEKVYFLAGKAFAGVYEEKIIFKWLKNFYQRFFSQQFKRSCSPDGPKVGSVSFSPRGDWRMPSDASVTQWLGSLKKMETTIKN